MHLADKLMVPDGMPAWWTSEMSSNDRFAGFAFLDGMQGVSEKRAAVQKYLGENQQSLEGLAQ